MEDSGFLKSLFILIGGTLLVLPLFVHAYDNFTTHPALSQEIVKLFNASYPAQRLTNAEAERVIQGSIDEDAVGRWMRHFYDPIYNEGVHYFGVTWETSKAWSEDTLAQATYKISDLPNRTLYGTVKDFFTGETDYSWERAIYEYAWGNKTRALEALGHTLHLLEDATVPDHTRNDPHPGFAKVLKGKFPEAPLDSLFSFFEHSDSMDESPYEVWTSQFNRQTINVSTVSKNPIVHTTLADYFDAIAKYSNSNFFSRDTILNPKYSHPVIKYEKRETLKNGRTLTFGFGSDEKTDFRLVAKRTDSDWVDLLNNKSEEPFIKDDDNKILSDYWTRLSQQAVLNGAGVMKLFFDEVAKEKQDKILYRQNKSWLSKQIDIFKTRVFGIADIFYGITPTKEDLQGEASVVTAISSPQSQKNIDKELIGPTKTDLSENSLKELAIPLSIPLTTSQSIKKETPPTRPTAASAVPLVSNTSSIVPIAGGGGASSPASHTVNTAEEQSADITSPNAPTISTPDQDNSLATSTSITFLGSAESDTIISQSFSSVTATATTNGTWTLTLNTLLQGTTTIQFFATDSAGNQSDPASRAVVIDSIAPTVAIAINECSNSLTTDGCMLATTTLSIAWSSSDTDFSFFTLGCQSGGAPCANFTLATTTATSTMYTAPADNTSYTFSVTATDQNGTESTEQEITADIALRPLVINEIAWAGTGSSATTTKDEWIELFNPTSHTVALDDFTLLSQTDANPTISLSGVLESHAYYLIERTDDDAITDVTASSTASFGNGLDNGGEVLALAYGNSIIDKTPSLSACGGWCGGAAGGQYFTAERYDPWASGENSSNWTSWGGFLANGTNADHQPVRGTPGKRNSINYMISYTGNLLTDKTLSPTLNPYVIPGTLNIISNATLTIPKGIIIKLGGGALLNVNGVINATGTANEPIVFTSLKDDTYAGDTNQDAASTAPSPGDWLTIALKKNGSSFDHTIIRYGGLVDSNDLYSANIRADSISSFTLTHSVIEYANLYGVKVKNSSGTVTSNTIRFNTRNLPGQTQSVGIAVENGSPEIRDNHISDNTNGLLISGASSIPTISHNTFERNIYFAAESIGAYGAFSGDTAQENGMNGIFLQGSLAINYTLSADIPYLIRNSTYTVPANKTLTVSPGAIIKFDGTLAKISSAGALLINGTAGNPAIFTSFHDDTYGGDTDATSTPAAAGDWDAITISSASSTITHAIIRYGGAGLTSAMNVSNVSIPISDSVFDANYLRGLYLSHSASTTLENITFSNHREPAVSESVGLYLDASSATLTNTTFQNNIIGIKAVNGSSVAASTNTTFNNNTTNTFPPNLIP